MSIVVDYETSRSKFRRFIFIPGGIQMSDAFMVQEALLMAGFPVEVTSTGVASPVLVMHGVIGGENLFIETRRVSELDRVVDELFVNLLNIHEKAECRCSDCYACCSTSESWLMVPQQSNSCLESQKRNPSKYFVRQSLPDDPLFVGEEPMR